MRRVRKTEHLSSIRYAIACVVITLAHQTLGGARADNVGDFRLGEAIARKECSVCHQIDRLKPAKANSAPSFASIAKMESATRLSIRVFLHSTHQKKTMPSLVLSDDEVDAVAEYILSLRPK